MAAMKTMKFDADTVSADKQTIANVPARKTYRSYYYHVHFTGTSCR
jgi:hypothetical protein